MFPLEPAASSLGVATEGVSTHTLAQGWHGVKGFRV